MSKKISVIIEKKIKKFNSSIAFTGDKSLTKRPMDRIIEPLIKMGAEIKSNNNKLPITLTGVSETLPIKYILPIPSAQVKSSILLASLGTPGKTTIIENIPTRDHTEILLKLFGANIKIKKKKNKNLIELQGQKDLVGTKINICGDTSSAAIIGAASLINPKSQLKIKNVNINKTRNAFFKVLKQMNANIPDELSQSQFRRIKCVIFKMEPIIGYFGSTNE